MAEQQWAKIGAGPDGDAEQWGIFTRASSIGGWDIRELLNNKSGFGGTGRGRNTVTVAGAVYPAEEVNYLLYGKLFRLAEDTWVNPAALGPLYGFGPWYGPQGASNIYNYRISIGLALSVLYSFTDHGDYRGIGPNADARVAWYWAGYSSDLTLPKTFAIKGVPPGPPYKGPITWHIGTESGTSMGGSF